MLAEFAGRCCSAVSVQIVGWRFQFADCGEEVDVRIGFIPQGE